MYIPTTFRIGKKKYQVRIVQFLHLNKDGDAFGQIDFENNEITLANFVNVLDIWRPTSVWEQEFAFFHELIHIFQEESGMELDEAQADTFGKLMYEFVEQQNEKVDNMY